MDAQTSPPRELLENPAMRRILLVRHGETFQNRKHIVQGMDPTWGRLTPEGIRQAQLLAETLVDVPLDIAYCSPLERAVLTMSMLLVPRGGERTVPLVFADDLREINQGVLHGASHAEWKAAMEGHDPMAWHAVDGESWLSVQARVTEYLQQVILPAGHRNVLIVAHGGVNRGLLASLTGISMGQAWKGAGEGCPQDNTCLNDLVVDANGKLHWARVNNAEHLMAPFGVGSPGQLWLGEGAGWEVLGEARGKLAEFDPYG